MRKGHSLLIGALQAEELKLAADIIVDTGIVLTGGGALLTGLESELRAATHLPIRIAAEPAHCAVLGAGRAMEQPTFSRPCRSQHGQCQVVTR